MIDRLSDDERKELREFIQDRGVRRASDELRLAESTMLRAVADLGVRKGTVCQVRSYLPAIRQRA